LDTQSGAKGRAEEKTRRQRS